MKRFCKFISKWGFPLVVGLAYWIFDAGVDFITPVGPKPGSFTEALLPMSLGAEALFRAAMTLFSAATAWYFERSMHRMEKLEQQLFLSEFAVANTSAFAMFWTDAKGSIIKVNTHAAERLGYKKHELMGTSLFDLTVDHTPETWNKLLTKLKKEGKLTYSTKQKRKDGSFVNVDVFLQYLMVKTDHYQFAFICDTFHDINDPDRHNRPVIPTLKEVLAA